MRSIFLLAILTAALSTACSRGIETGRQVVPELPSTAPQPPDAGHLKIEVTQEKSDEATLRLKVPASWGFGARVTWYRNGKLYVFPEPATQQTYATGSSGETIPLPDSKPPLDGHLTVTTALPPDDNVDPFKEEAADETWVAEAVPFFWLEEGDPVRVEAKVHLSRGCEVFHPGWVYVGCRRNVVFSVPLTEPVNLGANSAELYLGQFIEKHFLARPGNPGHDRFRAFINLVAFSAVETTDVTLLPHDPDTYLINADVPLPAEHRLAFDRTCLGVPLVGSVCLHAYATDVDNEKGNLLLDYGPEAAAVAYLQAPPAATDTSVSPGSYGEYDIRPLGGNRYEIALRLHGATGDLLFEPPIDSDLIDVKNDPDAAWYHPEMDLSSYVKAYGHAAFGTPLEARFEVVVPNDGFDGLDFTLITVGLYQLSFQFIFRKGPYCNSNLGTTETPAAGQTYSANPKYRPFDAGGQPFFAGLVSDTASGNQGGGYDDVLRTFYNKMSFPYPHDQSNPNGGSGVGRDRIGVNGGPYEFDPAAGRFSDNPNNCVRPADACLITYAAWAAGDANKLQDGGPEWLGNTNTGSCEWPNVSNNGDDATYKVSEQITSIIPYLQGELKGLLTHQAPH